MKKGNKTKNNDAPPSNSKGMKRRDQSHGLRTVRPFLGASALSTTPPFCLCTERSCDGPIFVLSGIGQNEVRVAWRRPLAGQVRRLGSEIRDRSPGEQSIMGIVVNVRNARNIS